jgi:hypothetical protein
LNRGAPADALGHIFSHIIDLARYFVGELREVFPTETFVKKQLLVGRYGPSG